MKIFALLALLGFVAGWFFPREDLEDRLSVESREERGESVTSGKGEASRHLTDRDLKALMSMLSGELHPVRRKILIDQILEGMTVENAELIRQGLSPMYFPDPRFMAFYRHWGQLAGPDVINLFGGRPKQYIFAGWAEAHPEAARDWAEQFERDTKKLEPEFHASLVVHLAEVNLDEATAHYFDHLTSGRHEGALRQLSEYVRDKEGFST
ncbi:MAG: hypothetical protein ACON5N_10265 [Akkermansiaceae bacterium]